MTDRLFSRRALIDGALVPALVGVRGGRLVSLEVRSTAPSGVDDLGELVLMPALVDTHVHINEPGRTEWEGFATATRAAATGGITRLVDMPLNSIPVTTSQGALEAKRRAAAGQLWVDVGFWGGIVPGNLPELAPMIADGVFGFKAFLCPSGIDDFPQSTADDLRRAMPVLRDGGVPLLVHAELESEVRLSGLDADPRSYARYLHSRPKVWEDRAVALVIDLVRETGCRAHIVHLSSASALPLIAAAKAEGLPLTVETCPHYLCLRAEDVPDGATAFKCAPPIREDANREALWAGLKDGTIDLVLSDHSPCVPALKRLDTGDFEGAWGGIASVQLGLANVWSEASRRGFGVAEVASWMSSGPQAFLEGKLGVDIRAGTGLQMGGRADLVAWAPDETFTWTAERIRHRHALTPYLGRTVRGDVRHTWLRGECVLRDGELVGEPTGRTLRRGE